MKMIYYIAKLDTAFKAFEIKPAQQYDGMIAKCGPKKINCISMNHGFLNNSVPYVLFKKFVHS